MSRFQMMFNRGEKKNRQKRSARQLRVESLEDRMLLAVMAGNESAIQNAAVIAPMIEPTSAVALDTPTNLAGTGSNVSLALTWDAVANASSYSVAYSKDNATWTVVSDITTTSTTLTSLTRNELYYCKVMAVGDGTNYSNSAYCETILVTTGELSTEVTTLNDSTAPRDGAVTLREAVQYAAKLGTDITFKEGLTGTISLLYGQIEISNNVVIDGDNRITVSVADNISSRLFNIQNGQKDVTFKNITLTGGNASNYEQTPVTFPTGGAVFCYNREFNTSENNFTNVTFENCTVTGNMTNSKGGAGYFYGCNVVVKDSVFSKNVASDGGALYLLASNFSSVNGIFTENIASSQGGALILDTVYNGTFLNSEITNNKALAGSTESSVYGGGIYARSSETNIFMTGCSVTGNMATTELANCGHARGGGIYIQDANFTADESTISHNSASLAVESWGGGIAIKGDWDKDSIGSVRLNKCYVQENVAGDLTVSGYSNAGGGIYADGSLTLVDSVITGNQVLGYSIPYLRAGGIYTGMTAMVAYFSTISGNQVFSYNGNGLGDTGGGIRDMGNTTLIGCALIGNTVTNMNSTDDETDDIVTDSDIYSFALVENNVAYMRIGTSVVNPATITLWNNGSLFSHLIYGTYYTDATYTVVSSEVTDYLRDDNIYETNYGAFYNDWIGGDYTLAANSTGIDSMNMDVYGNGFGYEFDIRGEGYYRVVNNVADMGAYEFQVDRPTFEVTIEGYSGVYDGQAHTVTLSGLEAGDVISYSADGVTYSSDVLSYSEVGNYTVYVMVERTGYQDWTGSASVVIEAAPTPVTPLATPLFEAGNVASYGANRHSAVWGAVTNAVEYELAYSANGATDWTTVKTTELSTVVTNLTYGAQMSYKVRAIGDGVTYSDSEWSEALSLNVCPMDLDGDGRIGPADRTLLASAWLARPSSSNWDVRADIDGNNTVASGDRTFLTSNYLKAVTSTDLSYPPALAEAVFAEGVEVDDVDDFAVPTLDVDFDFFG